MSRDKEDARAAAAHVLRGAAGAVAGSETMNPQPSRMKKGTRVWTCDGCKATGTWGDGWRYMPGIISETNKCSDDGVLPIAFCSDACEDAWISRSSARGEP